MPLTEKPSADDDASLEDLSEDDGDSTPNSDSNDSWDDDEDGSVALSGGGGDEDAEASPQPQPGSSPPAEAAGGSPSHRLSKTGRWFKRAFKADAAAKGLKGGLARLSASSMESDSTAATAGDGDGSQHSGGVLSRLHVPAGLLPKLGVSRLSSRADAHDPATPSGHSLGSHAEDQEEAMPSPPAGGSVPIGMRLPTHLRRKLHKELADLALVQELPAHDGVIWTAAFSRSGCHLATAGQDGVVRVWAVIRDRGSSAQQSSTAAAYDDAAVPGHEHCPVFEEQPFREWRGHDQEVLVVAWSASGFLLSGSEDKTTRLWHLGSSACLRTFRHSDWVTAVQFQPGDDQRFMSASVDGKVRVWSIPEQRVIDSADLHEVVTAAAWSPNGQRLAVGTLKGKVRFYAVDEHACLEYEAQIDVKNRRGKQSKGRKVTGLAYQPGGSLLLVTSADARLRLFDGYALASKLKGPALSDAPIRAIFSPDGQRIICGSDDGWAFLWEAPPPSGNSEGNEPGANGASAPASSDKIESWEAFFAGEGQVTVALEAPAAARRQQGALARAASGRLSGPWARQEPACMRASRSLSKPAIEALSAAEASLAAAATFGAVFVATTDKGCILVAENLAAAHWL